MVTTFSAIRIIPAYAGSTQAMATSTTTTNRIIPAYAGSTRTRPSRARKISDHPRIRGEHGTNTAADYAAPGSSPHTRGALQAVFDHAEA